MTPEELARLLGIEQSEPKLIGEQKLPRDDSARGYVMESLQRIAERLDHEGDVVEVLPDAGAVVRHLQWALGIYFLAPSNERERFEVLSGASLDLGGGEMLVDGREAPAVVRVSTPGEQTKAFVLGEGKAELWLVGSSAGSRPSLVLAVPNLDVFTHGIAGSPDIEAEFGRLRQSDETLERIAAPGLLLRFWVPADREIRRKRLLAMAFEDAPLLVAVRGWYSSLDAATRRAASELGLAAAHEISAMFAELAATADDATTELATRVALERDRLESVRRVLVANNDGDALTATARLLDNLAATHLTQLADAGVEDARLRRVLASEPDAWWGVISG